MRQKEIFTTLAVLLPFQLLKAVDQILLDQSKDDTYHHPEILGVGIGMDLIKTVGAVALLSLVKEHALSELFLQTIFFASLLSSLITVAELTIKSVKHNNHDR